jgi:Domain of unknown function (DUF4956)
MAPKDPIILGLIAKHRKTLRGTLLRISIYYLVLAAAGAAAVWINPGVVDNLPLGGIRDFTGNSTVNLQQLEDALLSANGDELEVLATETARARAEKGPLWLRSALSLLYAMTSTLLLMLPVSWVYKAIHEDSDYDHSIDTTTLVLPAVVAGIVTVVQHSLALAFSLAGIVAGVRFRRALSDTFDTLFILASIGVGIAAGIKSMEIAIILTVFFNYASIMVCMYGDGLESQHAVQRERRRREQKDARKHEQTAKRDPNSPMSGL